MASLDELVAAALATPGDVELDLSACSTPLDALPAATCEALGDRLVKLNAPNHALTSLPPSFSSLRRARVLFFLGNGFEAVPSVLGQLPSLFMLSLKANAVADVPEGSLPPSLGWLILTDNRIPRLPRSFGVLTRLRKLMLASNKLAALPEEISLCTSLELVRLSDNLLESLPTGFLRLPRLAWLALAGNPLCPAPLAAPVAAEVPRASLTLGARLGDGASGTVYEAELGSGGRVAVKVFKASSSDGRPEDELTVALALPPHACLIETRGFFRDAAEGGRTGSLGLVMELVSGELLGRTPSFETVTRDTFPRGAPPLALVDALEIARGVSAALAHMHAAGIVHGDVYAHNILVCRPTGGAHPKLGDLGAAWAAPPSLLAAATRLEARAFGCLLEDLLGLCEVGSLDGLQAQLESLTAACLSEDVDARPTMAEAAEVLSRCAPASKA